MASARAEQLIQRLLERQQDAPVVDRKTRMPYGWAIWLRGLEPLPRPQHAREVVQALLPRPAPVRTGVLPQLGMLESMRRLLWQHWDPPPRDQRWMRWTSAATSLLLHLLFALLLVLVAVIQPPVRPADGGAGDGDRVQVAFVGETGQGDGSGAATVEQADASAAGGGSAAQTADGGAQPATAESAPAPTPTPTPTPAAQPQPIADPTPEPQPSAATAQPLQATNVDQPTHDFVVPPVTVARTEVTIVPRRDVAAPAVRERTVEVPPRPQAMATVPPTEVQVRPREAAQVQVRERAVAQPLTGVAVPMQVVPRDSQVPIPQREVQVRERDVPVRPQAPTTMAAVRPNEPVVRPTTAPAPASVRERTVSMPTPAATSPVPAPTPAPASTPSPAATATATPAARPSAAPVADPGNWAQQARSDDWSTGGRTGQPAANAGGRGSQGMFNADGSVRVPSAGDVAGERGAPGGEQDGWSRERIEQAGTWLQRPPYDYTPTSLDKYWVPHESLLSEWVRRGIKSIDIPLPGTSTRIRCVVSLLQAGGGCGLSDPNMQDQPAVARPPPDIPFKKELQEDNGSR